jgi:hypothetical protein
LRPAAPLLALLLSVGLATASVIYAATPGPRFFGFAATGDEVAATIDGVSCGDSVTAAADGLWILDLDSDAACRPSEGDEVRFTLNGAPTNETETYAAGGSSADAINGTTLTLAPIPARAPAVPGLASFLLNDAGDAAAIGWTRPDTATSFQFCNSSAAALLASSCAEVGDPAVDVDWDTVHEGVATADDTQLFTSGSRYTSMRACNLAGCSRDSGGPLAGGLRWAEWEIDFDYMAVAFDFGQTRFTIAIVVNVSGPPRTFTIANGPPNDPNQEQLIRCRLVRAGSRCVAFLQPGEGEHFEVVSIVSEGAGTPATEHHITVR